jgi:Sec-independent protein secretion pathway component TatC
MPFLLFQDLEVHRAALTKNGGGALSGILVPFSSLPLLHGLRVAYALSPLVLQVLRDVSFRPTPWPNGASLKTLKTLGRLFLVVAVLFQVPVFTVSSQEDGLVHASC